VGCIDYASLQAKVNYLLGEGNYTVMRVLDIQTQATTKLGQCRGLVWEVNG